MCRISFQNSQSKLNSSIQANLSCSLAKHLLIDCSKLSNLLRSCCFFLRSILNTHSRVTLLFLVSEKPLLTNHSYITIALTYIQTRALSPRMIQRLFGAIGLHNKFIMNYDEPQEQEFNILAASLKPRQKKQKNLKFKVLELENGLHYHFLLAVKTRPVQEQPKMLVYLDSKIYLNDSGLTEQGLTITKQQNDLLRHIKQHGNDARIIVFLIQFDFKLIELISKVPFVCYFNKISQSEQNLLRVQKVHQAYYYLSDYTRIPHYIQKSLKALRRVYFADLVIKVTGCIRECYYYFQSDQHPLMYCEPITELCDQSYSKLIENPFVLNPEECMQTNYYLPYLYQDHKMYLPITIILTKALTPLMQIGKIMLSYGKSNYQVELLYQGISDPGAIAFVRRYFFLLQQLHGFLQKLSLQSEIYYSLTNEESFYSSNQVKYYRHEQYFNEFIQKHGDPGHILRLLSDKLKNVSNFVTFQQILIVCKLQRCLLYEYK